MALASTSATPHNFVTTASATVDRLRHNAYCLTLDGASYRAPRQGPNRAKNALASTQKNIDS